MNSSIGIVGAFLLAIGGALLIGILTISYVNRDFYVSGIVFSSFISFLAIGIGLWLIVLSGKPETK